MRVAKALTNLVEAFERLPGIGPKSAQRLTYYLLHVPQAELDKFAGALSELKRATVECGICHNVAETDPCDICSDPSRQKQTVCVVSQPLDVLAVERSGSYKGVYHVLHGEIDPLHNIGPDEIRIWGLMDRLKEAEIEEVILALNPTMEGEATCLYINRQITTGKQQGKVDQNLRLTRLASGLPMGADIEYADDQTLSRAMDGRRDY